MFYIINGFRFFISKGYRLFPSLITEESKQAAKPNSRKEKSVSKMNRYILIPNIKT